MVTGEKDNLVAGHLWPARAAGREIQQLGLQPSDILCGRNGILMCNGIEKAFDRLQLCFLPDTNGDLVVRILDDKLAMYDFRTYDEDNSPPKKRTGDKNRQFLSIEGRKLCYKNPPWRRVLWLHAYVAIGHMQKCAWNACNPLGSQWTQAFI